MKVVSVVDQEEVIQEILGRLGLLAPAQEARPPPGITDSEMERDEDLYDQVASELPGWDFSEVAHGGWGEQEEVT